ncbi:hypothetical protein [Ruegeria atlantica]|uniref:hypothetical protein n=1 Tax=Ruegeria atlantica TaxID=81569 RepID=UPI00147E113E|nr:hypothetical protein [Ruegeria atlantica]
MAVDLSTLKNDRLLDFLLAVAITQEFPGTPLHKAAGYDLPETNIATATARQFGLVNQSRTGRVTLTQDGLDWAMSKLTNHRVAALLAINSRRLAG